MEKDMDDMDNMDMEMSDADMIYGMQMYFTYGIDAGKVLFKGFDVQNAG